MTRDNILAALPSLKKADLMAVRALADSLLGTTGTQALQGPLAWLYEALMAELGANMPYDQFIKTNAGKAFNKCGSAFVVFMESNFKVSMGRKVSGVATMRVVIGLLAADLKERQAPITPFTLSSNLSRSRDVFDRAFPGYLDSGLVNLITSAIGVPNKSGLT